MAEKDPPLPWWVLAGESPEGVERYKRTVLGQRAARQLRSRQFPEWEQLTDQQKRGLIFALQANGLNAAAIARELLLSPAYVHHLLGLIWRRIHRRADVVFRARRWDRDWKPAPRPLGALAYRPPAERLTPEQRQVLGRAAEVVRKALAWDSEGDGKPAEPLDPFGEPLPATGELGPIRPLPGGGSYRVRRVTADLATIEVVPVAYAKNITATVGFVNPGDE